VAKVKRDYKGEYARRIAGGAPKGIARSQAGGRPKPREAALSAKRPPQPIEHGRLQCTFGAVGGEWSLGAAAEVVRG
jgi:hypothetical protein